MGRCCSQESTGQYAKIVTPFFIVIFKAINIISKATVIPEKRALCIRLLQVEIYINHVKIISLFGLQAQIL